MSAMTETTLTQLEELIKTVPLGHVWLFYLYSSNDFLRHKCINDGPESVRPFLKRMDDNLKLMDRFQRLRVEKMMRDLLIEGGYKV